MLQMAKLDGWNVRTLALSEIVSPSYIVNKNQFVTVRDIDGGHGGQQILGAVKGRYHPMQNEDAFYWADEILDGGGKWDVAGTFNDSVKVFGCLKIDTDEIVIDRDGVNDKVETYLMVSTSHDGSLPLQATVTNVRIICQNTFNYALKQANNTVNTFKIRHTATAQARAEIAREALQITFKSNEEFNLLANQLFQRKVSVDDYTKVFNWLYPKPDQEDKLATTRWTNKLELIHTLRNSPTNAAVNNTAWGLLNTFSERLDWYRQGDNVESHALAASGFSATANNEKARLLDAIQAL
jgi:phage/plasmid-like protein (TIGR03299 family)